MSDLPASLWLSLRIATAATSAVALFIIPLAYFMARCRPFIGRTLLESLILLPLVLPPTVIGYLIILLFGGEGMLTHWLTKATGYSILFRFEGAVLAAAVVALPMMYLPAKAAFATIEPEMEETARTSGATAFQIFIHISLPIARRGLLAAVVLTFARALGEFGATVMVFGQQPHAVTLPIAVFTDYYQEDFAHATAAMIALLLVSFSLIGLYNFSAPADALQTSRVR